ncbi:MAG: glycosyl transferase family 2 [Ignavibacteria bacterium CG_4_8_14_3_um_filter_37_9]|nr:glycosyltransferase [Ignavibacteria bacterium]OIO16627.1 MAG: glycosyl transferase family 2 [Ignavibacteria bacterium CG1_02_37_35]PIP76209.1 MAG: glycosyl transferase family 2 [Ignavibacteria bacterium CG22_combo_CG10-13_8_21_14_all_37_15]PIS43773.1 MAG: glycosyl transferase family 2 [Ignavibacteria bacterium CG08_land_8_20_14_0_20_37_9]PIX00199.1 MAG: glycosyl transferase family 2 [Ignavibacteria bacterium CG_4_8_14_3_um_filter_37_9]PIX95324.1 MAG: glycosyl transferase family 2 [Ignavibac
MDEIVLISYFVSLFILFVFSSHGFFMIYYYNKYKNVKPAADVAIDPDTKVTIQLPLYNELYVVERLIDSVCEIDFPKDRMEIQVLDDSTDETVALVARKVAEKKALGFDILHVRRAVREGFKAGALKEGMKTATGEFIAIFDADFIPSKDFLKKTLTHFTDNKIGMVQTRWEHLNGDYSILTKAQALALDGHFVIEQNVRNKAGFFINFNGTGGIWRRSCIEDAGNWHADTLTEDLDLSYRAQLKGWRFVFLRDEISPAELPSEINALKAQQFRWTKGAIETAKKILPLVLKSKLPLRVKLQATFHLTNNLAFPFILLAAILNVPLIFIKNSGSHEAYFAVMSIFILAFIGSFIFYLYSQKDIRTDWRKKIVLFPLFMAGSMGFAVNNSRAVIEGLLSRKSDFVRTPKFKVVDQKDSWANNKYVTKKLEPSVIVELMMALYCLVGIGSSIYFLEIAAIPFQLLFFIGFSFVSVTSIRHAYSKK